MLEHRYTDLQPLRSTAVGDVSSAVHRVLGRPLHVCIIAAELRPETRATLDARVKQVSTLTHPNILAIVDADFEASPAYFVTEAVRAETLLTMLHEQTVPQGHALRIVSELLAAVHCAHSHDVVHGGLSPARVFFDAVGAVRLGDFGVGSARTDARAGTVAIDTDAMPYLPVRVLRNPEAYDSAADLHCAGAIAFHLLTGTAPESGPPSQVDGVTDAIVAGLASLMSDGAGMRELNDAIAAISGVVRQQPPHHQEAAESDAVVREADEAAATSGVAHDAPPAPPAESTPEQTESASAGNEDETTEESVEELRDASAPGAAAEPRDIETAQHPTSNEDAIRALATAEAPAIEEAQADATDDGAPAEDEARSTARGLSPARVSGATVAMTGADLDAMEAAPGAPSGAGTSAMDTVAGIPVGNGSTLLEPNAALLEQVAALSGDASPRDDVSSLDVTDEDVQSSGPHVAAEDDSDAVASLGDAAADSSATPVAGPPAGPPPSPESGGSSVAAAKEAADRVAGKLNKYAHLLGQ